MPPAIGMGVGVGFDGGRPFIPTDYDGCKLWLPAEQGISLLSPSADRARWLDRSGNFSHVNQTVAANKPALNGKRLEFEAGNTEHVHRGVLAALDNGYTVGIALRHRALPDGAFQTVLANGTGTTGQRLFAITGANLRTQQHVGAGAPNSITWGTLTTSPETHVVRHDGAGNSADFCLNGAHQAPQALTNNVAPLTTFSIGGYIKFYNANVDVWGLIIYSDRKSDAIVGKMTDYLTALRNEVDPPAGWHPTDETNLVFFPERPDWYSGQAVSDWANQGTERALRDIAQALVAKQMVLIPRATPAGGPALHGDGVDDFLNGAWAQAQPVHQFAAALVTETDVANATMVDGGAAANTARMYRSAAANLGANAGALLQVACTPTDWHRLEAGLNGASSRFRVDDLAPATGDLGAATTGGLTVGAQGGGGGSHAGGLLAEIIRYARPGGLLSTAEQDQLHAYLARHGC